MQPQAGYEIVLDGDVAEGNRDVRRKCDAKEPVDNVGKSTVATAVS